MYHHQVTACQPAEPGRGIHSAVQLAHQENIRLQHQLLVGDALCHRLQERKTMDMCSCMCSKFLRLPLAMVGTMSCFQDWSCCVHWDVSHSTAVFKLYCGTSCSAVSLVFPGHANDHRAHFVRTMGLDEALAALQQGLGVLEATSEGCWKCHW